MRRIILGVLVAIVLAFPAQSVWATEKTTTTITYPYYAFVEDPENPWSTVWDALDSTDTIEYSDEFFNDPSPGDHPELRALSYAVALAGFENEADGYPSTSQETNPKLTDMLNQMGFSDYENWDASSEANGHSMGTTIGRKTLSSGKELIIVAPRNYNYMTEWLSNFNVGTSGDHAGFSESANLIGERFNQYVANRDLSNSKVWVVGYSRGGAVVDLFAKNINEHIADYGFASDDFYVYTFGAPRASVAETNYSNIHDVKDGNDLLLGFVFPEVWGLYNTGAYEEVHPADLVIDTCVVDISDLVNSENAMNLLANNDGATKKVGEMNGREFMIDFLDFVTQNGLTRDYFDAKVKAPLSNIMQAYQLRTLDKQSEFTDFITDMDNGMAGRIAGNALLDFITGGYTSLDEFPTYQEIVKIAQGVAVEADIDDLTNRLTNYIGEYNDYKAALHDGEEVPVTEEEFNTLKTNLPELVKVLLPIVVADAKYTQETYGEDYSFYYTYTLISNANNLVYGHIPESIMPILKSMIPVDPGDDPEPVNPEDDPDINVPNSGYETEKSGAPSENAFATEQNVAVIVVAGVALGAMIVFVIKKRFDLRKKTA